MALVALEALKNMFCNRCGQDMLHCIHAFHTNPGLISDPEHAQRIRARYAFGKLYNPDHDTTSYVDAPGPGASSQDAPTREAARERSSEGPPPATSARAGA